MAFDSIYYNRFISRYIFSRAYLLGHTCACLYINYFGINMFVINVAPKTPNKVVLSALIAPGLATRCFARPKLQRYT